MKLRCNAERMHDAVYQGTNCQLSRTNRDNGETQRRGITGSQGTYIYIYIHEKLSDQHTDSEHGKREE